MIIAICLLGFAGYTSSTLTLASVGTGIAGISVPILTNAVTIPATVSAGPLGAAVLGAKLTAVAAAVAINAARSKSKRQAPNEADSCSELNNPKLIAAMARSANVLDCGRRFVCEIEATTDEAVLSQEEKLIKTVFR